ncbi:hypothetical protein CKO42_17150 [Lamprobacter modestohalophilus]|uniref:Uncharacterized protein n=1 Tax=Lamprobacter modestohalophilus TaxID=1064514 RepID=A0A9X0WAT6_9GAMM|nr:hypothetical protein [Lamprobacter modestohalophilus]
MKADTSIYTLVGADLPGASFSKTSNPRCLPALDGARAAGAVSDGDPPLWQAGLGHRFYRSTKRCVEIVRVLRDRREPHRHLR